MVLVEDSTCVRTPDITSEIRTLYIHVLLSWIYSKQGEDSGAAARPRVIPRSPALSSRNDQQQSAAGSLMFEPASKGPVRLLREAQSQEGPPAVHAPPSLVATWTQYVARTIAGLRKLWVGINRSAAWRYDERTSQAATAAITRNTRWQENGHDKSIEVQLVAVCRALPEALHEGDGTRVRVGDAVCACASPLPGEQLGEEHTQCLAQEVAVSGEQKPHSTRQ
jgi:hypothetical protein